MSQKTEAPKIGCLSLICTWAANHPPLTFSDCTILKNWNRILFFYYLSRGKDYRLSWIPSHFLMQNLLGLFSRNERPEGFLSPWLAGFLFTSILCEGTWYKENQRFFFFSVFSFRASCQIFLVLNQLSSPQKLLGMVGQASVTQNFISNDFVQSVARWELDLSSRHLPQIQNSSRWNFRHKKDEVGTSLVVRG